MDDQPKTGADMAAGDIVHLLANLPAPTDGDGLMPGVCGLCEAEPQQHDAKCPWRLAREWAAGHTH